MKTENTTDRNAPDDSDEMDSLYDDGSGDSSTSKDTSGDDETVDQEDQREMAGSSVVPMATVEDSDGNPLKKGDKVEMLVMAVYGGKEVQLCRADKYPDKEEGESGPDDENEEIDQMASEGPSQRM